jgi:hypothetical protein
MPTALAAPWCGKTMQAAISPHTCIIPSYWCGLDVQTYTCCSRISELQDTPHGPWSLKDKAGFIQSRVWLHVRSMLLLLTTLTCMGLQDTPHGPWSLKDKGGFIQSACMSGSCCFC